MAITKIEVPELFDFGSDNSAFKLPTGTTAERPTSPSNGEMRFNTTTGFVEYYDTTKAQWWEIDYEGVVPSDNFNSVLYTGNSSTQAITNVGFAPDFVWIKRRNSAEDHALYDSVRGTNEQLSSNTSSVQATNSSPYLGLTSFDSDGFTSGNNGGTNRSPNTYVAWSWKAGGTAVSNTDGTVTSQVSANVSAGFSIITSTSPAGAYTWGHGLSKAPELWIHKATNYTFGWETMYPDTFGQAAGSNNPSDWNRIFLNTSAATTTNTFYSATDTVLSNAGWGQVNNFVTYAWHSVAGYSKIGTYTGNGSSTGTIVDTGFTPRFVMIKATTNDNGGGNWLIYDSARSPSNPRNKRLYPDLNIAETTSSSYDLDFLTGATKGFQPKNGADYYGYNTLNVVYIYMAFA